jgi:putative membrane-bound dehydrogenase-like protein
MSPAWMRSSALVCGFCLLFLVTSDVRTSRGEDKPAEAAGTQNVLPPSSGEPLWIWSPTQSEGAIPEGHVYFRKRFLNSLPETALLQITADDSYEVHVNGRYVGQGNDWHKMQSFNLLPFLVEGKNLIAVKAKNAKGATAGVTGRIVLQKKGGPAVAYVTDETWLTSAVEQPQWEKDKFDDSKWLKAHSFGELGAAKPWLDDITAEDGSSARRFAIVKDFRIERVIAPNDSGSLLTMAFNEFGEILAGREGGPIVLIADSNKDGVVDKVTEFYADVKSCQGLLALNGNVYAVGDGPEGSALYLIADDNHDGKGDSAKALLKFTSFGEHGPHGLTLGPDGMIYVMIGNHAQIAVPAAKESPYHDYYEGDLLVPRYEDPGGHAVGVKAPGGTVVRLTPDGKSVQMFAGGFRNAFDLAFNAIGELFTFDSDMEWNEGLPFYRATRLQHVFAGSEHGWRSGWGNWPDYNFDGVAPAATAGRGSPTGMEFYDHEKFPPQYRGALFACDWSQGEIIAFKPRTLGGGYTSEGEVFVRGRPLAATDLAVGPDGWLYFVTGGRGTEGGLYRVVYTGQIPAESKTTGVAAAVRQPQLQSAWARQRVAVLQQQVDKLWGTQLQAVAANATNAAEDRIRALELLELCGPFPEFDYFLKLSQDRDAAVRKKVAYLLGVHAEPRGGGLLVQMLKDTDPAVRRQACESLARGMFQTPPEALLPLLAETDRTVSFTARLALERVPVDRWKTAVLESKNLRTFVVGAAALTRVSPDKDTCLAVLKRGSAALRSEMSDPDFLDLLRLFELALERGQIRSDDVADLRRQLADEYPAGEIRMNRELVRLLAYLDESSILPRLVEFLKGNAPTSEKIHTSLMARYITKGWTPEQKLYVLAVYEGARRLEGGYSLKGYFDNVSKDFCASLTTQERLVLLAHGDKQPANALAVLSSLTAVEPEMIPVLVDLDKRLPKVEGEAARTLQTGIVAILGEAKDPRGMAYLREAFEQNPERRPELSMGLSQMPDGENWPLLLRALPVIEGMSAQEVMLQLAKTNRKPEGPEPIRQAILCGLRLRENGADMAVKLLRHWTDHAPPADAKWDAALASYQQWFATKYPEQPPATPPRSFTESRYNLPELTAYLAESSGKGDPARGALVFEKAACVKCHRFGGKGEAIGPDLTSVAMRFQRKEILESLLFPSQVVSDQYSSKTVTTTDGKVLTGIVAPAGDDAIVVLQPNTQKATLPKSQVESIVPSKVSAMPEGLLNHLQMQDIADLFAYLNRGAAGPATFATDSPTQEVNTTKQARRVNDLRK